MIEYFFKNGNLGNIDHHVIRGRVVCIIVFIVSIWSDLLVFLLMIMSNIRNVFTNKSIGCVTKCGPAGILEIQPTDVCKANVLKSSYEKFE